MTDEHRFSLLGGGYGSAKTWGLIFKAFDELKKPNNRVLIGRRHLPDLRNTSMVDFFELLPPEWLQHYNKSELRGVLKNGSTFLFRPCDDAKALGSYTLGAFAIDEAAQVPEQSWDMLCSRLRHGAVDGHKGFAVSNPDGPAHYLAKRFVDPATRRLRHAYFNSDSRDNVFTPQDYRDTLVESYSGKDLERFVGGAWIAPEGRIWWQLDRARNVIPHPDIQGRFWTIDRSIDFGFHHDFVCLWTAWDEEVTPMRGIVLREYFANHRTLEEHATSIREVDDELRMAGWQGEFGKTWSDHDEQDRHELENLRDGRIRIRTTPAKKARVPGMRCVNAAFHQCCEDGWPRLLISDRCPKLIQQAESYARPENATKEDAVVEFDSKGASIVDGCDALRYEVHSRIGSTFRREVGYQAGMPEHQRRILYEVKRQRYAARR